MSPTGFHGRHRVDLQTEDSTIERVGDSGGEL